MKIWRGENYAKPNLVNRKLYQNLDTLPGKGESNAKRSFND